MHALTLHVAEEDSKNREDRTMGGALPQPSSSLELFQEHADDALSAGGYKAPRTEVPLPWGHGQCACGLAVFDARPHGYTRPAGDSPQLAEIHDLCL